nr:DNA mismatch repair protein MutS, type 1 [Tanacetum cinerariifolium]
MWDPPFRWRLSLGKVSLSSIPQRTFPNDKSLGKGIPAGESPEMSLGNVVTTNALRKRPPTLAWTMEVFGLQRGLDYLHKRYFWFTPLPLEREVKGSILTLYKAGGLFLHLVESKAASLPLVGVGLSTSQPPSYTVKDGCGHVVGGVAAVGRGHSGMVGDDVLALARAGGCIRDGMMGGDVLRRPRSWWRWRRCS